MSIRTAVVGYGFGGRIFHCPFVHAVPGLELATIVVSNAERAAQARKSYPKARITSDLAAALEDPAIDLIVVTTPNETHYKISRAALLAGKHVVADKPTTTTSVETRELITIAAERGKVLAPFHNRRFDCNFLTIQQLHAQNTLGRIVEVVSSFDRYRPLVRPNTWKEAGPYNGLLFDLGPHLLDQALALFGTPARITGRTTAIRDTSGIDDYLDVTLEFDTVLPAAEETRTLFYHCHATMLAADPAPSFRVHGTHGSYTKQGLDPQEAALLRGERPTVLGSAEAEKTPWLPEPESSWGTLTLSTKMSEPVEVSRKPYPSLTGDYRLFYANVRDAINDKTPLLVPTEDAYRVLRLLELTRQSSEQQRTLNVTFL